MKFSQIGIFPVLAFFVFSCTPETKPEDPKTEPEIEFPFEATYDIQSLPVTDDFAKTGISQGQVSELGEVSGLATSMANPAYLWAHEDSGNDKAIYLISKKNARVVATFRVTDSQNIDWEDMAIGPGPQNGINYLYLADIGDNQEVRNDLAIYRVPEPFYKTIDSGKVIDLAVAEKLLIAYPDSAHDAEALMVDPLTGDIFIVTKRESRTRLYRSAYPQPTGVVDTLELIGTFPFTQVVAGDISQDGSRVLLKSYPAIFYWRKERDEPLINLLAKTPKRAPYDPIEIQGEAICLDGNSYYTLSEKLAGFIPKLYFYKSK